MKKGLFLCLLLGLGVMLTACWRQQMEQEPPPHEAEALSEEDAMQEQKLTLCVNGKTVDVRWEENETVAELAAYAQKENIVVNTTLYGGFEQVGDLPQGFARGDTQTTANPGDISLYSGDQIVVFFGSNSWSYTMLGHIQGLSAQELSELLGGSSAVIDISLR